MDNETRIVTPEAVSLDIDVAGIGSRMIALLIDHVIQAGIVLALLIPFAIASSGHTGLTGAIIIGIALFAIVWGYFPLFETIWHGRTPGKRAQHLRVVLTDGRPANAAAILVRNLIRIVDFLPGFYAVGCIAMLTGHRSQRLGDLAAGTLVVHEHRESAPIPMTIAAGNDEARVDTGGLTDREYAVVRAFLSRRYTISDTARADLARQVAATIRTKLGVARTPGENDEIFLENVAKSFRGRFGNNP